MTLDTLDQPTSSFSASCAGLAAPDLAESPIARDPELHFVTATVCEKVERVYQPARYTLFLGRASLGFHRCTCDFPTFHD